MFYQFCPKCVHPEKYHLGVPGFWWPKGGMRCSMCGCEADGREEKMWLLIENHARSPNWERWFQEFEEHVYIPPSVQ